MTQNYEINMIVKAIPYSALILKILGVFFLISGFLLSYGFISLYTQQIQPLFAGISVFALGLACISIGFTLPNILENRITTQEIFKQLNRIEEKLDKLERK